ncbi:MAG TPA: BON domain-containing protein [Terriglobales bacterium]|jgi:osmotically-inducible protein OsmY|nr:BON domain-containing protein [Terriglobales bacterium]
MKSKFLGTIALVPVLLLGLACTNQRSQDGTYRADNQSYKDVVKQALQQSELQDVTVDEDRDKNTITLGGKVHSEDARQQATEVAKAAAGNRVIANEISVQPVGAESASKDIASDRDTAIEKNYKATLIAKGLDKKHIRFDAKNGVITLKGSVTNPSERRQAEQLAAATPNVRQVVNEIDVNR